jgi:hypothetical protein
VDLGQGDVVMWMKDEVQGSDVTRQDVTHVESTLHGSSSNQDCSTGMVPHRATA